MSFTMYFHGMAQLKIEIAESFDKNSNYSVLCCVLH